MIKELNEVRRVYHERYKEANPSQKVRDDDNRYCQSRRDVGGVADYESANDGIGRGTDLWSRRLESVFLPRIATFTLQLTNGMTSDGLRDSMLTTSFLPMTTITRTAMLTITAVPIHQQTYATMVKAWPPQLALLTVRPI